jgi:hypothetical protein
MKVKPYSRTEMLIVGIVMASVLIPLRLVAILILGDSWIGSIGVLTGVTLFIMIGSKKGWLGWFGNMFINTIVKIQKGRRRYIFYIEAGFIFVLMGGALFIINEGETTYEHLTIQVRNELADMNITSTEDVMEMSGEITPEQQMETLAKMPQMFIEEFATIAVTAALVNEMMGGWYKYFAALVLIENVEIIGFLIISRRYLKEREAQEAKS